MGKISNVNKVVNNMKKKLLSSKKTIIVFIAALFILIYCIYLLIKLLINPTNTFIVENAKIYKEESTTGYILRDEQIVQNEATSGNIVHLKAEGEKVANGEAIYRYSMENEQELNSKIQELDIQIQEAMENENNLFSSDIELLETQIETKLDDIYESTNIQEIEQYKKNITTSITKKAKIAGELAPKNSYLKNLVQERTNYENQLNSGSQYIYANRSGIISYRVDNLESKLTVTDFSYLNKKFLESLNIKTSQIIATSDTNVKIIDNLMNHICNFGFIVFTKPFFKFCLGLCFNFWRYTFCNCKYSTRNSSHVVCITNSWHEIWDSV